MLIDIFNDRYEKIGVADKKEAHAEGLWHRVFSCLVVCPARGTILLQKKHQGQYSFDRPDFVDMTVGGHYQAGEEIQDGVREIHEELGLDHIRYSDVHPIGIRQVCATVAPNYIIREFQHLHLLALDQNLEGYTLGNDEVAGLIEISIQDGILLGTGEAQTVPAQHLYWPRGARQGRVLRSELHRDAIIPSYLNIDQLHLRLCICARRYISVDRQHLCW